MKRIPEKSLSEGENLNAIRKLLEDFRDQGEYRYYQGNASTTPTDIDFIRDFGFPVKCIWISNDGAVDLQIGYMSENYLLDVSRERFFDVMAGDPALEIKNNIKCIRRIIIQTAAGVSAYRLRVFW